jgi:hypothetical protein
LTFFVHFPGVLNVNGGLVEGLVGAANSIRLPFLQPNINVPGPIINVAPNNYRQPNQEYAPNAHPNDQFKSYKPNSFNSNNQNPSNEKYQRNQDTVIQNQIKNAKPFESNGASKGSGFKLPQLFGIGSSAQTENKTGPTGAKDKNNVANGSKTGAAVNGKETAKELVPLTKKKFLFQAKAVRPEDDDSVTDEVVYYVQ